MVPVTHYHTDFCGLGIHRTVCGPILPYRATGIADRKHGEDLRQQGETFFLALERLEDWVDKRFAEFISHMTLQISELRTEIANLRSDMKQEFGSVREELSKLNQNHIGHLIRRHDESPVYVGLSGPPMEKYGR